jgi:CheY-like chemotaxis protein
MNTQSNSAIVTFDEMPPVTSGYAVRCLSCDLKFDAMDAAWCECVVPLRTFRCSHCGECFCKAPLPYKRRFWNDAPRELRQNERRFFVQLAGSPSQALANRSHRLPTGRAPRVLVVDDDESMKSLVACFAEQMGYRVTTASDPIEALATIDRQDFDLVITDALMPRMDGRELCHRIKSAPDGARKRVIVMSSLYTSRAYRAEARDRFGADELVKKPIDFSELAILLDRLAPFE